MNCMQEWVAARRWRLTLSHVAAALAMQAAICWAGGPAWAGALWASAWYWGRETAQYQMRSKIRGQSTATVAWLGLLPWQWGRPSLLDWLAPTLATLLVTSIVAIR